jgi:hypothetical protein
MDIMGMIQQLINAVIGVGVIVFLYFAYIFYLRHKNQKETPGHIKGYFLPEAGAIEIKLCKVDGNEVTPPEGHDVAMYFLEKSCTFPDWWNPKHPKLAQVSVEAVIYKKNVPEPIVSKRPEEWIESEHKHDITARMVRNSVNQAWLTNAVISGQAIFKDLTQFIQFVKNMPYVLYAVVFNIIISIVVVIMLIQVIPMMQRILSVVG